MKMTLTENMRALRGEQAFCAWLILLGDGALQSTVPGAPHGQIDIPDECHLTQTIVDAIYPDFNEDRNNCVILSPKNESTHEINKIALDRFNPSEQPRIYVSYDKFEEDDGNEVQEITTEFLNSLTPSGMPLHSLQLKEGCPIMLLRNLDTRKGLSNGVRLKVIHMYDRILDCQILSGSPKFIGKRVYVPKVRLTPSDTQLPFKFSRIQFPIRLAYCITINKSQGQSFDQVGIYLPAPVFSHGQLYVAFSRARSFDGIHVMINNTTQQQATDTSAVTMNVVFALDN